MRIACSTLTTTGRTSERQVSHLEQLGTYPIARNDSNIRNSQVFSFRQKPLRSFNLRIPAFAFQSPFSQFSQEHHGWYCVWCQGDWRIPLLRITPCYSSTCELKDYVQLQLPLPTVRLVKSSHLQTNRRNGPHFGHWANSGDRLTLMSANLGQPHHRNMAGEILCRRLKAVDCSLLSPLKHPDKCRYAVPLCTSVNLLSTCSVFIDWFGFKIRTWFDSFKSTTLDPSCVLFISHFVFSTRCSPLSTFLNDARWDWLFLLCLLVLRIYISLSSWVIALRTERYSTETAIISFFRI